MNTLRIFNPLFADSLFDVLEKQKTSDFGVFSPLAGTHYPAIDIRETGDTYIMEMDLPGFTEKDVRVDLKDRILTIASVNEENNEVKEDSSFLIRERVRREFVRRFTLPEDIDRDQVQAAFKNGILTVTIPRKEEVQQRQIDIKVS